MMIGVLKRLALIAALLFPAAAYAQEPPQPIDTTAFGKPGFDCAELRYVDFSTIEDAITQITDARPLKTADGLAYCQVEGYVWRSSRFRVRYPLTTWNGKLVVLGTGGQAGGLPNDNPAGGRGGAELRKGFATVQHDGGHFSTITDAQWAYMDDSASIDMGFRTAHMVTVASKAIIARATGKAPTRSYYCGCSNGGREAMIMAQRFPNDFDGVIAGAPSMAVRDLFVNMFWIANLVRDQSRAGFDMKAAKTLHAAVIKQCDKLDGKVDAIVDDPRRCQVDFAPVTCKAGPADDCLTDHQVDIARKIYDGPRDTDGKRIGPSSAFPGSEISWVTFITPRWAIGYADSVLKFSLLDISPGPNWKPEPAKLASYAQRMGVAEAISSATNPDLRPFVAHGGKLLSYYGWNDAFGGSRSIMDYYETVERIGGGEAQTKTFFRLFMIPGMDHCYGGEGAFQFDFLDILDRWVETGKEPDTIVGAHIGPDGKPLFERTVAAYRTPGSKGERK